MKQTISACLLLLFILFSGGNCFAQSIPASGTNLPIVILTTTNGVNVPEEWETKVGGTMKMINNGPGRLNHVTDSTSDYNGLITIIKRGESSTYYPQAPYAVTTVTSSGANNNVSVLGMPADNDWVLISLYNDRSFMRNLLAYKISNELGHYTSRSFLCEVLLNGDYRGVYIFGEKIKQGDGRVDIAKLKTTDTAGDDLTGGYIFKDDVWDSVATDGWESRYHPIDHPGMYVHFLYDYPKPGTIVPKQEAYIQSFIDSFETVLYSDHFADSGAGYHFYINDTSFVDYGIVNEVSRNPDGFKKSCYFYKDKNSHDRHLFNAPVWDFDWAWKNVDDGSQYGNTDGSGWSYRINDDSAIADAISPGWFVRLLQDCSFTTTFRDRYYASRGSFISLGVMNHFIDSVATILQVDSAEERHFERWGTLGVDGPTPEPHPLPTTYQGEVDALKAWIKTRLTWLDANMPECPSPPLPPGSTIVAYPSPATDHLVIAFPAATGAQTGVATLVNLLGQRLYSQSVNCSGRQEILLGGLQSGCYILRITAPAMNGNNAISYTQKIIIAP